MVNKVILVGNLGADPEIRFAQDGNLCIAGVRLATSRRVKQQDGSWGNETEWHRVTMFGRQAEVARDYLRKGSQIYCEGRLHTRKWQDQEGKDRYSTDIICENFQMLGSRNRDGESSNFGGGSAPAYGSAPARSNGFESAPRPAPAAAAPAAAPAASSMADTGLGDDDIPF